MLVVRKVKTQKEMIKDSLFVTVLPHLVHTVRRSYLRSIEESSRCGAKTKKMSLGHRGANHPVKDLLTVEKELEALRTQLKSGVEAIALPPSDLDVNEVKIVEIQEVEVELEEMKKSMNNS